VQPGDFGKIREHMRVFRFYLKNLRHSFFMSNGLLCSFASQFSVAEPENHETKKK
jgi:hypothetical protein